LEFRRDAAKWGFFFISFSTNLMPLCGESISPSKRKSPSGDLRAEREAMKAFHKTITSPLQGDGY